MSVKDGFNKAAPRPPIKTLQHRIDELKARRPTPKPQRQLAPGGQVQTMVQKREVIRHEQRIQIMTSTNTRLKQMVKRDFSRDSNRGRAKAAFDRSR